MSDEMVQPGKKDDAKKFTLARLAILPAVIFLFFFLPTAYFVYYDQADGTVTNRFNRSGNNKGLFLRIDKGHERKAPVLWEKVAIGDRLTKTRGSFVYCINSVPFNGLFYAFKHALGVGIGAFLFYFNGAFIFGGLRSAGPKDRGDIGTGGGK